MIESQKVQRRALNLSLAIYRLSDKLPADEIIRKRLKQLSGDVVGALAVGGFREAENKISRLLVYFQIAQQQNWVKPINWWILGSEYRILKQEIFLRVSEQDSRQETGEKEKPDIVSHNIKKGEKEAGADFDNQPLSSRHARILGEIKKKQVLKISTLIPLFKGRASERTLRNDLRFLMKKGLVSKRGDKKSAVYRMK
ncbi:MAG: DeoR family transcriptional regulator, partial [Candidatus Portnoybacteria bacterium]|nr:DeoR family transcriptional regulator [Candidatus Portnoybacteria bacterium]